MFFARTYLQPDYIFFYIIITLYLSVFLWINELCYYIIIIIMLTENVMSLQFLQKCNLECS